MKKFYALLLTVIVLSALALPLGASASVDPSRSAFGSITALSPRHMTVHTTAGNLTLKVRATTRVFIDNAPSKYSALKVGDTVDIEYLFVRMVATRIEKQLH